MIVRSPNEDILSYQTGAADAPILSQKEIPLNNSSLQQDKNNYEAFSR